MAEVKQLDFEGNHCEPPKMPPDPLDLPLVCDCGQEAAQPCAECGRPLCETCTEKCEGCERLFCAECDCPDCVECASCGEKMTAKYMENEAAYGDEHSELEGKPLHEYCYCESRVGASIHYSDQLHDPASRISDTMNETEGEFMLGYTSTDAWRGYYTVSSETWTQIHDDCALAYSGDESNLAKFDKLLRRLLDENNIRWARVICSTSNVCSAGYELYIPNEDKDRYDELIAEAKAAAEKLLRDPWDFNATALTGKSAEERTSDDNLFALIGGMIMGASQ